MPEIWENQIKCRVCSVTSISSSPRTEQETAAAWTVDLESFSESLDSYTDFSRQRRIQDLLQQEHEAAVTAAVRLTAQLSCPSLPSVCWLQAEQLQLGNKVELNASQRTRCQLSWHFQVLNPSARSRRPSPGSAALPDQHGAKPAQHGTGSCAYTPVQVKWGP